MSVQNEDIEYESSLHISKLNLEDEDNESFLDVRIKGPAAKLLTDEERMKVRMKRIQFFKQSIQYQLYIQTVPKKDCCKYMPKTPNPNLKKYSCRGFEVL